MPQSTPSLSPLRRRVAQALDALRPAMQSDGGDVELVEVTPEGIVHVRLHGACVGCPSSDNTLKQGIEATLRQQIPEVTQVLCVS